MKTILIIDASVYFRRAYYNRPADPVSWLMDAMQTLLDVHHPDERIVALDAGRESWRNQIYPAYKGTRKPPDPAYTAVLPAMRKILDSMCLDCYEREGYEADDVIGSLCKEMPDTYQKIICSPDKDLMQLVDDKRRVGQWDTGWPSNPIRPLDEEDVRSRIGVYPHNIPDLFALTGDLVDNIPGVAGIGKRTACNLLAQFGSLENLYDRIDHVKPQKTRSLLEAGRENAFLSKQLATIKTDLNILKEGK